MEGKETVKIPLQQLLDSTMPIREPSSLVGTGTEWIIIILLFGKKGKQRKEMKCIRLSLTVLAPNWTAMTMDYNSYFFHFLCPVPR